MQKPKVMHRVSGEVLMAVFSSDAAISRVGSGPVSTSLRNMTMERSLAFSGSS